MTFKRFQQGIHYGSITANPDGSLDNPSTGVDPDLVVKPFLARSTMSFGCVGAHEWGEVPVRCASAGTRAERLDGAGMALKTKSTRRRLRIDHNGNEIDPAVVDHLEFYLLNYFNQGRRATEMTDGDVA